MLIDHFEVGLPQKFNDFYSEFGYLTKTKVSSDNSALINWKSNSKMNYVRVHIVYSRTKEDNSQEKFL